MPEGCLWLWESAPKSSPGSLLSEIMRELGNPGASRSSVQSDNCHWGTPIRAEDEGDQGSK